jgi:hypothetical protein
MGIKSLVVQDYLEIDLYGYDHKQVDHNYQRLAFFNSLLDLK